MSTLFLRNFQNYFLFTANPHKHWGCGQKLFRNHPELIVFIFIYGFLSKIISNYFKFVLNVFCYLCFLLFILSECLLIFIEEMHIITFNHIHLKGSTVLNIHCNTLIKLNIVTLYLN